MRDFICRYSRSVSMITFLFIVAFNASLSATWGAQSSGSVLGTALHHSLGAASDRRQSLMTGIATRSSSPLLAWINAPGCGSLKDFSKGRICKIAARDPCLTCLRDGSSAPFRGATMLLGHNVLRQQDKESLIARNVWVARGEDEGMAVDSQEMKSLSAQERGMLKNLKERMSRRERHQANQLKVADQNEQQSIMERERLREKLALRGQVHGESHIVPSNLRRSNKSANAPKTPSANKGFKPSHPRGRQVRAAFRGQSRSPSRSPSPSKAVVVPPSEPAVSKHVEDDASSSPSSSSLAQDLDVPSMPKSLSSFQSLGELVKALEPVVAAYPAAKISGADAVGAMNRLKRLQRRGTEAALYGRHAALMKTLGALVLGEMERMPGKLLSLAVNAVAETRGHGPLLEAASRRARWLAHEDPDSFDIQAVAVILNGFARAGIRDEELFHALGGLACRMAVEVPEEFAAQSVSVVVNALAKLRIKDEALLNAMAQVALTIKASDFSAQSVANILNAYAREDHHHKPLLEYMSSVLVQLPPEAYQSRHLSVSVNALAKFGMRDERALKFVEEAVLSRSPAALDVQAIANLLNAYGKLLGAETSLALLDHLAAAIHRTPTKALDPSSLASIFNALSKIGYADDGVWGRLCGVVKRLDALLFDAQAVSTIMHALAKAERFDKALFDRLAETVGEMQFILEAQSIALILNACAKTSYANPKLMRHLSAVAQKLPPDSFSSQHVDNIVNSFARLGFKDKALFSHMAAVAQQLPPAEFDAQAVAVTLNAFAKQMVRERASTQMFAFFSREVLPGLCHDEFSPTSVSVMLNAYAKAEIREVAVVQMLCGSMLSGGPAGLEKFDGRNIASVLHALATLYVHDEAVTRPLMRQLIEQPVASLQPEEVAIIAWSSAVLNIQDREVIAWLLEGLKTHLDAMDTNLRRQAHQFLLSCELQGLIEPGGGLSWSRGGAPGEGDGEGRARWLREVGGQGGDGTTSSRLQRDVAQTLADLGVGYEEEFVDARSGYSLDVLLSDGRTAIEVDGPSHFARGSQVPLGNTRMKRRHVAQLGFDLRILPYWEWDELTSREEKQAYLRALLTATPTFML